MEITLEKIELVKDRTGVTYKEAKEALEAADGNVVDAIISIEDTIDEQTSTKKIGKQSEALVDKMKEIVKRGNVTRIIIRKDGEKFLNVPVNAGVLGAVIAPWGMIAAALVALGTKCEIELLKKDGTTIDLSGKAENLAGSAKETGSRFYEEFKEKAPGFYEGVKEAGEAVFSRSRDEAVSEADFDREWYGGMNDDIPQKQEDEAADVAAAMKEATEEADAAPEEDAADAEDAQKTVENAETAVTEE